VSLREPKYRRENDNNKSTTLRIGKARRIRYRNRSNPRRWRGQGINTAPCIIRLLWLFRNCPKCSGDLYYDVERDREYIHCLQCGYEGDASGIILTARAN
jgi:hypothetical protein